METLKNITLKVEGMNCASCASTITKGLEKKGYENVNVNFATGEANFILPDKTQLQSAVDTIDSLGYKVVRDLSGHTHNHTHEEGGISNVEKKFYFTLPFTIPLFLHMFLSISFLHNPVFQLIL